MVIFITGASKGFGKLWAAAALQEGHQVVATARSIETLSDLVNTYGDKVLPLTLDVTDRERCFKTVEKAQAHFGRIDVLISNAGYGHLGMVEELSEKDIRVQMDTNYFGSLWMMQAVLPVMRAQRSGHILQLSSVAGVIAFMTGGAYNSSKWAVEGLCDALSQEVAAFGIKVTIIEPTGYATDFSGGSLNVSEPIDAYKDIKAQFMEYTKNMVQLDPAPTSDVIMELIKMEQPPLRLFLGAGNIDFVGGIYKARLDNWQQYQELAAKAQ